MNAVAPEPVTNAGFTWALGRAVNRPAILPLPEAALRLAFGEMSSIMLASQRVVPRVATSSGYQFRYPSLDSALKAELSALTERAA